VGALAIALAVTGCGDSFTEVIAVIDAEPIAKSRGTRVHLVVGNLTEEVSADFSVDVAANPFPLRLPMSPQNGDVSRGWRVEAELFDESDTLVSAVSESGAYSDGERVEVALWFRDPVAGDGGADVGPGDAGPDAGTAVDAGPDGGDAGLDPCSVERASVVLPEPARIMYVDGAAGADDASCGDMAAPCRSIEHALGFVDALSGPTFVDVHGGGAPYPPLWINGLDGTPEAPTVIKPWPGTGTPSIDAAGAEEGIRLRGVTRFVVIDGFEVFGSSSIGIELNGADVDDNIIRNCRIHGNGEGTSTFPTDAGILIINGGGRNRIEHNEVFANTDSGGPEVRGIAVFGDQNTITDNLVYENEGNGIVANGAGALVTRNRVIRNGRYGIHLENRSASRASDNVVCGNGRSGLRIVSHDGADVLHNALVGNEGHGIELATDTGLVTARDNFLVGNEGFGIAKVEPAAVLMHSHNLYFENVSGVDPRAGSPSPDVTFTDDPMLTDAAACDVTLAAMSPARRVASDGCDLGPRPTR
jgi:hypothetical protein